MYKVLFSFTLLCCFLTAGAKKKEYILPNVNSRDTVIGTDLRNNRSITARQYSFQDSVYLFYNYPDSALLTVQLRPPNTERVWPKNSGDILVYDKANNHVNWGKPVVYTEAYYSQTAHFLSCRIPGNTLYISPTNGSTIFETPKDMYYADADKNIGLGFSPEIDSLKGVNMRTGRKLWARKMDRSFGFEIAEILDDSCVMVEANGLHKVNLYTGRGWDYNTKGGKNDYTKTVAAVGVGILFGVFVGYAAFPTGHDVVSASSNVLRDDGRNIYYASAKHLACLDSNGKLKWEMELPRGISNSALRISGNILYMFALGTSTVNAREKVRGDQFVAAFDKTNGTKKFLIEPDELNHIEDFLMIGNTIMLMDNTVVYEYNATDGRFIASREVGKKTLKSFAFSNSWVPSSATTLQPLQEKDPGKTYIITDNGALAIDDKLSTTGKINKHDLYSSVRQYKDYLLLLHNNEFVMINAYGDIVARRQGGDNYQLSGNTVLFSRANKIYEVDLNPLIQ